MSRRRGLYSSQLMMTAHWPGSNYGADSFRSATFAPSNYGSGVPADPVSAVATGVSALAQLTGTIIGAATAPKTRAHEEKMAKLAGKTAKKTAKAQERAATEARLAAEAQAASSQTYALYAGVSVIGLGLASLATYAWVQNKKIGAGA